MENRHKKRIQAMKDEGFFDGLLAGFLFWLVFLGVFLAPRYFESVGP